MSDRKTAIRAWLNERPMNPKRKQLLVSKVINIVAEGVNNGLQRQRVSNLEHRITSLETQVIDLSIKAGVRDAVDVAWPPRRI